MNVDDELDAVLDRFFGEGPNQIGDAVVDAALVDIETTSQQRVAFDPRRFPAMPSSARILLGAAALVAVALIGTLLLLRPAPGVGDVTSPEPSVPQPSTAAVLPSPSSGTPSPAATASAVTAPSAAPSPFAVATPFTSTRYAYTVTLPGGWTVIPATSTWDGSSASGFDSPDVDQWLAPHVQGRCVSVFLCAPTLWAYSTPTSLSLSTWVAAQDAAEQRDHQCGAPSKVTSVRIDGGAASLEDGHCGAGGPLILAALTVRDGIGYAFLLQDNTDEAHANTLDRQDFNALLRTIRLGG